MELNKKREANPKRLDRLLSAPYRDPYIPARPLPEPTICSYCGLCFSQGRWHSIRRRPPNPYTGICPACHRIQDNAPAGYLTLTGSFFTRHQDEIISLLHHKVAAQSVDHPLQRIMAIKELDPSSVEIAFTDMHLPRIAGLSIKQAYDGDFELHDIDEADVVRAYWQRN